MVELVPKLVTSDFSPSWREVNISQALAASKTAGAFIFALKEAKRIGNHPHYPHASE